MINPEFKLDVGYIQIYMGNGKGKTTASLGLTLRHLGHGGNVLYASFCKGNKCFISGEKIFFKNCKDVYGKGLNFKRFGSRIKWEAPQNITYGDKRWAIKNWKFIKENYSKYSLVVLDEVTAALKCGLLSEKRLIDLLRNKPEQTEIVLTGRIFPESILNLAHLVTSMEPVKHYWDLGVMCRNGIEV